MRKTGSTLRGSPGQHLTGIIFKRGMTMIDSMNIFEHPITIYAFYKKGLHNIHMYLLVIILIIDNFLTTSSWNLPITPDIPSDDIPFAYFVYCVLYNHVQIDLSCFFIYTKFLWYYGSLGDLWRGCFGLILTTQNEINSVSPPLIDFWSDVFHVNIFWGKLRD